MARHYASAFFVAATLSACASVNTTLDRVNQGLAALVDTTAAGTAGAKVKGGVGVPASRGRIVLDRARPGALREDSLTTAPSGSHRYTIYEIDTQAWPDGGVLHVDVHLADAWPGGRSTGSFDVYPESVAPAREGSPTGAVASAWDLAPGQRAQLVHRFSRGQRFLFGAEGGWGSPAGTRNRYVFTVRVTPAESPVWAAAPEGADASSDQAITLWRDARFFTVMSGHAAITAPHARGTAWGAELSRWLTRAERRDPAACATAADALVGSPSLSDQSSDTMSAEGRLQVNVTCGLRRQAGGRLAPQFALEVGTANGGSRPLATTAREVRALIAALQTTAAP